MNIEHDVFFLFGLSDKSRSVLALTRSANAARARHHKDASAADGAVDERFTIGKGGASS
jgi:hypothetical protein